MIDDNKKVEIINEFRKIILTAEKENLAYTVSRKGDSLMVTSLKNEFEKVVKKYENN